jgi:hypothetical protein
MDQRCSKKYTHVHCPAFKFRPHCKFWGSKCEFGVLQCLREKNFLQMLKKSKMKILLYV